MSARILIVEDDASVAMMIKYLLGCEVQTAGSAEKPLRQVQNEKFNLVTLGIDLQRSYGYEIYRELRENPRLSNTPDVFISARNFKEDVRHGLELGARDYIGKPFATLQFAQRIRSLIKGKNDLSPAVVSESPDA
jgi:DNA-binding response OmpR family regulator